MINFVLLKEYIKKHLFFAVPTLYLVLAVFSLPHLGIGWDTPVNLAKGEQVLNFLQRLDTSYLLDSSYSSGVVNSRYFNEIPSYENGHPPAYSFLSFLVGNFFSSIFGFKFYFFHFLNVFITFAFLYFYQLFTYKYVKSRFAVVLSSLVLISIPLFFIYTIVNTKDLPVVVFTFFSLVFIKLYRKLGVKRLYVSLFLFLLAIFSKFTAIYLVPVLFYFVYKDISLRKYIRENFITFVFFSFIILFATLFFFWPHLIFNFSTELKRLEFVYFLLPKVSINNVYFYTYIVEKIPIVFSAIFLVSTLYAFITKKIRIIALFWILPTFMYLVILNRYYEFFRQFLFIFVALSFFSTVLFARLLKITYVKYLFPILLIAYSSYYFFMPTYNKVYFSSILVEEKSKDVWGITLPTALRYVESRYGPAKIYFSPLSFLLEYQGLREKGYEIIYTPQASDIWIATTMVDAYEEERAVREENYTLDRNFVEGNGVIEVWVRKQM